MKNINETNTIGDLINSTIFGDLSKSDVVNSIIKKSTIFSFWDDVVGKKFAPYSRCSSIKHSKLYVSVKSPAFAQELGLYKPNLLKKINSYSMPLGIEIKDIIFEYKNFEKETPQKNYQNDDNPIWINDEEIKNIKLQPDEIKHTEEYINKCDFLSDNQKEKLLKTILNLKKVKKLQNNS